MKNQEEAFSMETKTIQAVSMITLPDKLYKTSDRLDETSDRLDKTSDRLDKTLDNPCKTSDILCTIFRRLYIHLTA